MALITPGPMAGQISGRVGSVVYSHNRGGPYVRNGTIPTLVTSNEAINAKGRLSAQSQAWNNLTDEQRLAWTQFALSNPVVNRLGSQVTTGGNSAYVGINTRLAYAGETVLVDPPIADPPPAIASITLSADIGVGTFDIAFTATPLAADDMLWVRAALLNNIGVNYVENLLRLLMVSDKALASPLDIQTQIAARFGTIIVGQKLIVRVHVLSSTTGLLSAPLQATAIVEETSV